MQRIKNLLGPKLLGVLALLYTVLLTTVSVSEIENLPKMPLFPMQDKVAHIIAYLILGASWGLYWMVKSKPKSVHPYFTVLLLGGLIYGTVIEVMQQQLTVSRSADVFDIFANVLGMLIGAILGQWFYNRVLTVK